METAREQINQLIMNAVQKKRVRKRSNNAEQAFQIQLIRDLRKILPAPECFVTAFPAGGGGLMRGMFLKSMGLIAGFPDLLLIYRGVAFGMELKAKTKLTETQRATHAALGRAGMDVRVIRSLDEAMLALAAWGIPTRIVHDERRAA